MRKPANQLSEEAQELLDHLRESATATTLVGSYEFTTPFAKGPFIQFKGSFPAQYRVEEAVCFRSGRLQTVEKLVIRVRQLGEGAVEARFLVVWNGEGRVNLPWIKPSPHDPPDSAVLQWSFWQGCRVGGGLYHDVFDVTHFTELQLPS